MAAAAYGLPKEEHQRARDDQDVERLEEAGQCRGVFKRMRGVHIEEAAPVGSEQLDWNLRRDGPGGDELLPALKGGRGNARVEILNHALPKHEQRPDDAQRQQHVQRDAHEIGPEVADGRRFVAGDAAHDRGAHGDADACGNEILIRQGHHLRKMAHGGFPAVGLPVRIRQEADRRIQGQMPRKAGEALRIQRQLILEKQHPEREQESRKGKPDDADGVLAPRLFFVGMDAGQRIDAPLHRPQDGMQEGAAAGKNLMDITPQQRAERRQKANEQDKLQQVSQDHAVLLKPFRLEQRVQHICKKAYRAGKANKIKPIHDKLLECGAGRQCFRPAGFQEPVSKGCAKMYSQ